MNVVDLGIFLVIIDLFNDLFLLMNVPIYDSPLISAMKSYHLYDLLFSFKRFSSALFIPLSIKTSIHIG